MAMPSCEIVKIILPNASEISEIKVGGQKAVFLATDMSYGVVVVKIMLPNGSDDRFKRELEIVSSYAFPNVPKIYSHGHCTVGEVQYLYIIEQYISGVDLREVLNKQKTLTTEEAICLLGSLLETIEALESREVVHRDIKPENILCSDDGKYWLLDFGIARDLRQPSLTATNAHFGPHTAGYAAPEQFRNIKKKIDARADLFSIGVVGHEVLIGSHPFAAGARDYLDILRRTEAFQVNILNIKEDTTGELSQFISLLMEKYPSRRPPSAKMAKLWFKQIAEKIIRGMK
ncbi:MAG: serine/threonine-protein kinase [Actinomycetota bacterium]|nr:serine/threonine-protein kinase [Actinomycetota bacterium]